MGAWQGVSMDSLKFNPGPPSPTLLRLEGGPPLKWHYGLFGDEPTFKAGGYFLAFSTPCTIRLWIPWVPHKMCRKRYPYAYGLGCPQGYKMVAGRPP
jgi:hypothetical protein